MDPKIKKVALWLLAAFALYAIYTSPQASADVVKNIWAILVGAVKGIGEFFKAILNR